MNSSDNLHIGLYKIKIIAVNPSIDPIKKLVQKAETEFALKVIDNKQDIDAFCQILVPNLNDYSFLVNN